MTDFAAFDRSAGVITGSVSFFSLAATDLSASTVNYPAFLGAICTNPSPTPSASSFTYFKRGWRTATSAFEFWQTTNPDAGPPSGNALIDITIIDRPFSSS
jgi:hypothetical protein